MCLGVPAQWKAGSSSHTALVRSRLGSAFLLKHLLWFYLNHRLFTGPG